MTFSWELDRLSLHFSQNHPANPKLQRVCMRAESDRPPGLDRRARYLRASFLVLLYRWFPAVLKTITIPARDDCALASCRLTLFPDFARAGASGSERTRCAAREPRITAPGREK